MKTARTVNDGIRIYSTLLLASYDFLIMQILSPYVWRCHPRHYQDLYRAYMSRNHADVGVGTGYILNRCQYQPGEVRIGLFDLQQNCLNYTAKRLARFRPETYLCNALEPIRHATDRFDSVALGGILHCIPGDMATKSAVFDVLRPLMNPRAQVFGYTILNKDVTKTLLSRFVYFVLQKLKVINGTEDSASQLARELRKRFQTSEVSIVGCIAIFVAQSPLSAANQL
ncbi:MAG: class I SAM-dependent methyltransferase [Gammaproteobacteria bacterium]|nr:class I SAM-dependent methyltransferase [Gammaproteobacteria bacterium]